MTSQALPVAGRTLWREPLARLLLVALGFLVVAAGIVVPTAIGVNGTSIFDESTHADYAYEVAHGHIPVAGSFLAPAIRAELQCRLPAKDGASGSNPNCDKPLPPTITRTSANQNYNWGHPPLYYALTGVLARAGGIFWSGAHFITLARLVGVLWLFAAMLVMYVALRRFAVRWPSAACGAVLVAFTPAIFYLDATVTNDAAAALCGAVAVYLVARILVDGKHGVLLPFVLGAATAGTKILNAIPMLAVAVLLVALALRDRRADRAFARRMTWIAAAIIAGAAGVYLGWTVIQHLRGDPNWINPVEGISSRPIHGLPFDELFGNSFTNTSLLSSGYVPPPLANPWMAAYLRLLGSVAIGAAVAVLAVHRTLSARWLVAAAAVLGTLAFPLLVELQVLVASNKYFPHVIPRYGTSLIPLYFAVMAMAADDRKMTRTIVVFTAAAAGVAFYTVALA